MEKPQTHSRIYYDFHECRDYILEKQPDLADAANDYWSHMVESEVNNGTFWRLDDDDLDTENDDKESWFPFEEAMKREFGITHEFYVWW